MLTTASHLIDYLRLHYRLPRSGLDTAGRFPNQAAVLIPLTDHLKQPEIILTKRADHLSSHSGEVSFPGGKWDDTDPTLTFTALRESEEEIGLPPSKVDLINVQPPQYSLKGIKVTPYVGIVPHDIPLRPNPCELDSIFRVPLEFFLEDQRTRTDVSYFRGEEWWSPVYHFDGYKIWGLTARILVEFLNHALDAGIERDNGAPEVRRESRRIITDIESQID